MNTVATQRHRQRALRGPYVQVSTSPKLTHTGAAEVCCHPVVPVAPDAPAA